ncbi:hypothetical protein [uncultured Roseobacter sp.]|uniref:hypothetical protein n=1 Tax=uncultured Roseobacter sp. TaxID=114847 RepID=UPI0026186E3E|nr:hypothetical protein [uncultured Roseobacter sp.]
MDHSHHHAPPEGAIEPQLANVVYNPPHLHAFSLIGYEHVFAVHMTQYHHEVHKYQIAYRAELPDAVLEEYRQVRRNNPGDFIVMCNHAEDPFIIPAIPSREKRTFRANIFQGMPSFPPEFLDDPHFFPWDPEKVVQPIAGDFTATVGRMVLFRPFAHHYQQPDIATYLLFGEDGEAHMTNLQTASLASGPFEPDAFGPDYDHQLTLKSAPSWLHPTLLKAGVIVTVPSVRLRDAEGKPTIPCSSPFANGETIEVMYRGMGPPRQVTVGHTVLCATGVSNSEAVMPCPEAESMNISPTPDRFLIAKQ